MSTTKPSYDERSVPLEASRRGAHRARPRAVPAALPILAGVVVVVAVIGGAYTLLGSDPSTTSGGKVAAAEDDVTAGPSSAPGQSATGAPSQGATPSATTSRTAAPVDRGIELDVLNSVGVQGLASRVQADLEQDGWTVSRTDNSRERNLVQTKIYFGGADTRPTARALLRDLGFGTLVRNAEVAGDGLIVVLGQDAQ